MRRTFWWMATVATSAMFMLVAAFGCRTPDHAPAHSAWYARAVEIVRTSKDADEIRGRMAALYCEIMNPIGDHAGMSADEKRAAISEMARGWEDAKR